MRSTQKGRKSRADDMASSGVTGSDPPPNEAQHFSRIATAAYYKAEARGFMPGRELDDWLEAEAEMHMH